METRGTLHQLAIQRGRHCWDVDGGTMQGIVGDHIEESARQVVENIFPLILIYKA